MIRALFVDDEPSMLELAIAFLDVPGELEIDTSESAKHALEKMANTNYDAIVSDYQMPLQNGIELLKIVRGMGNQIPFILFTGRGREEVAIEAINTGATFYLKKGGDTISQFAELKNMLLLSVEKEQAILSLAESELRYRRLFETAQDAILILDAGSELIIDANPFIENLLGYSRYELIGKKLWEIGPFRDIEKSKWATSELQDRGYIRYDDLPLQSKDGRSLAVEFVSNRYTVGSKEIIQCNIRDNSDRARAEDALARSNQKLNTLSKITNHDISNQITILEGNAQLLLNDGMDARGKTKVERILMAARNIRSQIDFAKEYQCLGENKPTWQRLDTILDEVTQQFDLTGVEVVADVGQVVLFGDSLLPKVFYNLIDNSLEHGGKVNRIDIRAELSERGNMDVIFQDNGVGISEDAKKCLFEHHENSAAGLALAKDILSITNMNIREVGTQGSGAKFEILIRNGYYRLPLDYWNGRSSPLPPVPLP
jgi:PAS domain S-box-containing protein